MIKILETAERLLRVFISLYRTALASGVCLCCSYQDVPLQKETRFNGDADAGLAVTLDITAEK